MLKRVLLILLLGVSILAAQTIDSIKIRGFDADKLKPIIGIKVGDRYSAGKVEAAKNTIKQSLGTAGYKNASVTSSISNKGGTVGVIFDINKGNKVVITKINFLGNNSLSSNQLSTNLVNKEAEFMGWFPGRSNGTANVPQLKYDSMRVKDEYYKRGYLDATVSTPALRIDPATSKAVVTYNIREGNQYRVAKIDLVIGAVAGIDRGTLVNELGLKSGEIFDVSKLRTDIKMITTKLRNLGYAYAKVMPGFMKNARRHVISVQYKVVTGSRATIGDIIIKGNKKTKDNVVRRYIDLAPGDLYNYGSLVESKKTLSRTGFFEKVVIKPSRAASPQKVNLEVDVQEAKTGAFTIGGGYGSADGWMINGSIKEMNIFGTGKEVGASIDYSKVTQSFSLSYKDPRLFDSKYSLSVGVSKKEHDYSERDTYDDLAYRKKDELGGYFSVGHQFTNNIYASIGYSYRNIEFDDVNSSAKGAANGEYDNYIKSSIIGTIVYDSTDDYYTPRSGIYAKIGFEYAGLGSTTGVNRLAEFVRYDSKLAFFYGLKDKIDYDLILRFKFRGSYISHDTNEYVPIAERLYLGGASRGVRGFKSGSISPYDGDDRYRIGGYRSYSTSVEASIPLSEASKMRLTFFADYGQIGEDKFDITQKSVGAQIEWRSPFGPINLILAKAIDPDEEHGDTSSFEFNIGGKF